MEWLPQLYAPVTAVALYLVPMFSLLMVVLAYKRFSQRNRINPLGDNLLRPAGYSLLQRIDDLQFELLKVFLVVPMMGSIGPLVLLLQEKFLHKTANGPTWAIVMAVSLLAVVYYIFRAVRAVKKLAHLRLGFACEMAVAQELEQLAHREPHPYRVFHDLPFGNFNIDHLVVSGQGVFVIETKGRSKRLIKGKKEARVRLEENALHFPTHVERQPLEQVRMNVQAVRNWLGEATGFEVPVMGILVLPGWYIERKQRATSPYVLSAKELPAQLPKLGSGRLDNGQLQAVAYQVAQRVRDVDRDRII